MYDSGKGVVQNHKTASKWYRRAADQEDKTVHHNLGVMYKNGRGVVRNYKYVLTILSGRILLSILEISISERAFGMVTGIDVPATFGQSEDWCLASNSTASFVISDTTKIAFINFNFPGHQIRCIGSQLLCDQLAELAKYRISVLRFNPHNSAADRAEAPATK